MAGVMAILAAAVGFVLFWWLAPNGVSFGFFEGAGTDWIRLVVAFVSVVIGVVLGSLYRQLRNQKGPTIRNFGRFFSRSFRAVDMWLGLVGSPLIFALLLRAADGMSLEGMIIVGLENGFCCLIILNSLLDKDPDQAIDVAGGP